MTKEELLQKGLSPELADEILASFSENSTETSLDALKKAMEKCAPAANLKKSDEGRNESSDSDEPDKPENDNDDEEYMKKSQKNLKKAVSGINSDRDGAFSEMEDLQPVLNSMVEFTGTLMKAVADLRKEVRTLAVQNADIHELIYRGGGAQIDILDGINAMAKASQGRKGVVAASASMMKAEEFTSADRKSIEEVLEKAIKAGNEEAIAVGAKFAAAGSNFSKLDAKDKAVISRILKEEQR